MNFNSKVMPAGRLKLSQILLAMKLTTILILAALSTVSASSYSQMITLHKKNISVGEVLRLIEKQTNYHFLYDRRDISRAGVINVDVGNVSVEVALDKCFKDQPLTYKIFQNTIVIKSREYFKEETLLKDLIIKGMVTGTRGEALPGVSIKLKGTTIGATTDLEGRYTINVPDNNSILVFTYIGYVMQEISVNNSNSINVSLVEDTKSLDEVVVVGYGTQKKVNLTGAVTHISSEVLESRPITNLGQGIQGIVANLNINPGSGAPGREVSFNIRGNTSINGGSPLVLVDGVAMDPNLINPQDVQSISVLKDAASASIYGARAAYGVILVTMKNGMKNKKPFVSLLTNYAIDKPTVVPKSMNSIEYTNFMNDGNMTSNGQPYFDEETMKHIRAYFEDPGNNSTLFQHSADPVGIYRENGNTDWSKELLKDSYPMQQYNASVTGGSDKITYYTSFGYLNQKGISKPGSENFDRYNLVQNISYDVNKWINLRAKVAFNGTEQRMNPSNNTNNFGGDEIYASYSAWPIVPVYAPDGNFDETKGYNMVAYLKSGGYQKQKTKDVWLTGALKMTPLEGLIVNVDYTYNTYSKDHLNYRKQYYTRDNGAILLSPWGNISAVTRNNSDNKYIAFNAFTEYEKSLGNHYLKGLVGFNQEFGGNNWFQAERRNLINNDIPYINLATGDQYAFDAASEYAIRGAFSRLNYSFDNRYLIELNGRYDGSSKFPKKNRFAFFPSVSMGWRVSNEGFFKGLRNLVSDLKLRASYGNLGNQAVSSYYPYVATYGIGEVNYLFGGNRFMTVYAPGLVSPMLTWEKVGQYNLGLDFAIFDDKLSGSFDIYERETKEMLAKSKSLPSVLATTEPQTNAANMKTNGFEFTLSWNQTLENKLRYGLTLLFSDYTAKITKYDNPQGIISDYYVGKNLGEIWGFETEGLFKTDAEALILDQSKISGHKYLAGDIKFQDLNGDNKITRGSQTLADHGDLKVIGNSTPRYSYGFRADSEWKGFDVTVFFQGVGRRDVLPNSIYFLQHYTSEWAVPQKINNDYWRPDNQDAYFPRARIGNAAEITQPQSRFLQNAAYLRLKQLTFGYSLPQELIRKANINKLRIYFSGNNLFESTKMLDIFDPEGFASNMYPLTRSFSFGMNLTF